MAAIQLPAGSQRSSTENESYSSPGNTLRLIPHQVLTCSVTHRMILDVSPSDSIVFHFVHYLSFWLEFLHFTFWYTSSLVYLWMNVNETNMSLCQWKKYLNHHEIILSFLSCVCDILTQPPICSSVIFSHCRFPFFPPVPCNIRTICLDSELWHQQRLIIVPWHPPG